MWENIAISTQCNNGVVLTMWFVFSQNGVCLCGYSCAILHRTKLLIEYTIQRREFLLRNDVCKVMNKNMKFTFRLKQFTN